VIKRNSRLIVLQIGYTCEWETVKERSLKRTIARIDRGRGYFGEFSEFISTYNLNKQKRLNIAVEQLAFLLSILKVGGFNLGLKTRGFWCFLRVPSSKYLSRISS
jgi:hypothetical protein